uniref:DDE Tnp4 domain-containing protein n=1 Tax=Plectus sambesii TaxID=2011161 RepID=A0A914V1S4_9BILA
MNLPGASLLPGSQLQTSYVIAGDRAFPLRTYLMKPFGGRNLPVEQDIFNYRLSHCRRLIKNTFEICLSMWRVLTKPIKTSADSADAIIKAVCCLHNFLIAEELNPDLSPTAMADGEDSENGIRRLQLGPRSHTAIPSIIP